MATIIKNQNGTYSFNDNGVITNNLKVVFDARKGCGDIRLPENNSIGRKWVSESRFGDKTEIDLSEPITRAGSGTTKTVISQSWTRYVAEEDLEMFNQIKERALKRQTRAELEAQIEAQKKALAEMMAKLAEETEETEEVEA